MTISSLLKAVLVTAFFFSASSSLAQTRTKPSKNKKAPVSKVEVATDTAKGATPAKTPAASGGYQLRNVSITFDNPGAKVDFSAIDMATQFPGAKPLPESFIDRNEKHLRNIRQLTFDGENAEAYLSPDDRSITFQARSFKSGACDQIFSMDLNGQNVKRISSGTGRTTCSYYMHSGDKILFATTQQSNLGICPAEPDRSKGYVWPLYPIFDIVVVDTNGHFAGNLTNSPGYDAEATVSPKGDKIIFTSTRYGDIDLYSMNIDGSDVVQLTTEEGYDGGAFYSLDGSKIVYRASRPSGDELKEYRELLKENLVRPSALEIYVMNADGTGKTQLTNNGAANFAPYFFPDGKRVIFSSNMDDPKGREFDLYVINIDGTGLTRVTYGAGFDGFPFFTRDGKKLVFCSNRNGSSPHNTNIFIADWVE